MGNASSSTRIFICVYMWGFNSSMRFPLEIYSIYLLTTFTIISSCINLPIIPYLYVPSVGVFNFLWT